MFDSIDLSALDNLDSENTFDGESGFGQSLGSLPTDGYPVLPTESSPLGDGFGELGDRTFDTTPTTTDSYPWDTTETEFSGDNGHSAQSTAFSNQVDLSELENEVSFKGSGYSQSEINSHITEAKHDIADAESDIRHHTSIANSKARMGEPHSFEDSQIRSAQSRLNEAKSDLSKWQHMNPSKQS